MTNSNTPDWSKPVDGSVAMDGERGLGDLSEELAPQVAVILEQVIEQQSIQHHSGWLPSPDTLQAYEAILPGLAERIVRLPEKEQAFRHQAIETNQEREYRLKTRGQTFALTSLVLLLIFSAGLLVAGHADAAAWVAVSTIVAVVGIFVTGRILDARPVEGDDE